MLALATRLQEIRQDRGSEWAEAELADSEDKQADHVFTEHAKVVSMEGFLKKRAEQTPSSPSLP